MWFILIFLFIHLFLGEVEAYDSPACTEDELYSSLLKSGRRFCSSMLNTNCRTLATPTQFTTFELRELSSQCACVLSSFTATETSISKGQTSETSSSISTRSRARRPGRPPATSTVLASTLSYMKSASSFDETIILPTGGRSTEGILTTGIGAGTGTLSSMVSRGTSFPSNSTKTGSSIPGTTGAALNSTFFSFSRTPVVSGTNSRASNTSIALTTTIASPTFLTPTGFNSTKITGEVTGIPTSPTPESFTKVTRTAYVAEESCYHGPTDPEGDTTRRALLQNAKLREANATMPYPYVESIEFESQGIDPLYMTVRDSDEGTYVVDVSDKDRVAIVDETGHAMLLDTTGIHFSTQNCHYDVSITAEDIYEQLADASGVQCSTGGRTKRMEDIDFKQTLYLRDQCGQPVTQGIRKYPNLKVGKSECSMNTVDEATGRWDFDCTFPGSESNNMQCKLAIKHDIQDFLLKDPFGGACPDLPTAITTLDLVGFHFVSSEAIRAELYNLGLNRQQRKEAEAAIERYARLWYMLKQLFSARMMSPSGSENGLSRYLNVYNTYRSFEDDICEGIHSGELPLKMSLYAGATGFDALARLNWALEATRPLNLTIQDPSSIACCPSGHVADPGSGDDGQTCAYPVDAFIDGTGCVCGQTASGAAVAFGYTECENFVSGCQSDTDCAKPGYPKFVCLTGSCCDGGVCIDPYQCSQNGTALISPQSLI
ncbi:hypothetical protein HJFPF1_12590 [Paramyrothecium foliicola]|nr:hypothetical protein HJFPF1_12590 [Paramyrothecium foliicola]